MFPTRSRAVPGKPHIYKKESGLWAMNPTFWALLSPKEAARFNDPAAKWVDTRNYFIGIKAGIRLGRALDCTARGCPVPQDDDAEVQRIGDRHAEWKTGKPLARVQQPPSAQVEVSYGPYN